ncbi:hypothetical protein Mterra_03273 [Calidithermus terrae]|uniref:Helix-turn-helix domain protein n=1 Tax=Calidithermus terrae TaxID=1408545 RepID=A0A399EBE8_9DEIN|nr:hypothetical protein [Calidithermus terrae]RIH81278.1 hypothetical protein Mterra_03273 [Calidithermus terrae]
MSVIRRGPKRDFTVLPNATLNDARLSWEALGMLAYLVSKPADWQVRVADLTRRPGSGRDRTYRILEELARNGYLERRQLKDARGRFTGWEYLVHDESQDPPPSPPSPRPENPDTAGPYPAKPELKKEGIKQKTEFNEQESKILASSKELPAIPPPAPPAEGAAPRTPSRAAPASPARGMLRQEDAPLSGRAAPAHRSEGAPRGPRAEGSSPAALGGCPAKRHDAVGELAQALGLAGWQKNFARVAVSEERTRNAWFYLARQAPQALKGSYRLLDKTGERGPVTWGSWLPLLAEDVRAYGEARVARALELAVVQGTPKGAWGYYRAVVEDRKRPAPAHPRAGAFAEGWGHLEAEYGPLTSGYNLDDLEREYGALGRALGDDPLRDRASSVHPGEVANV